MREREYVVLAICAEFMFNTCNNVVSVAKGGGGIVIGV